ncbi:MAG: 3'(2'),5'-bisphosphate nucleotidase [Acidobacteriota bacterium]
MYEEELKVGLEAVDKAMRISRKIQKELTAGDKIDKSDKSPVTIADFASQAVICSILNNSFPDIPIVGEEDSTDLKKPENREVFNNIENFLKNEKDLYTNLYQKDILKSIDLGNGKPDNDIFWTLDPIDGTKGFLRGEQYAVALALIKNGKVVLGISGCPNLKIEKEAGNEGFIFFAVRDEGASQINCETSETKKIEVTIHSDKSKMKFVQSYESGHGNLGLQIEIAEKLQIGEPPVQLDSQVKYGIVASGNAEIYLRIPNPKSPDYKEKIWDHAAGSLIVEEAGGIVSDINGKSLDFSLGSTLSGNTGILATTSGLQREILDIIKIS